MNPLNVDGKFSIKSWCRNRQASVIEVWLIAITLMCLPSYEALKNATSVLFLIAWLFQSLRTRSIGMKCLFNWPILLLAGLLWIAPLFSEFQDLITPLNSAPRWTVLALFVVLAARLDYCEKSVAVIWSALMLGGAFAVGESILSWSVNGRLYPELRSVGHVNHSSMYTLIPLAAGIGSLLFPSGWVKFFGTLAIASTLIFLPPSSSIVGAVAILTIVLSGTVAIALQNYSRRRVLFLSLGAISMVLVILASPFAASLRSELIQGLHGNNLFFERDLILNSALAVWDRHPIIGTGWFSFGIATSQSNVEMALVERGMEYSRDTYRHVPHGHNLWVTMLVERGLSGVVLVSVLLVLYFKTFAPVVLSRSKIEPTMRGVALSALLVVIGFVVAGLGNSTMMNEHGHAGMALISVSYGYLRRQNSI